jgi:hypothetical protein
MKHIKIYENQEEEKRNYLILYKMRNFTLLKNNI